MVKVIHVAPFTGAWSEIPIYFDEADFIYKGNKGRLKYLVVKELLPFQIFKSDSAYSNLQIRFCIACRSASQGDAAFFYVVIEFAALFRGLAGDEV